MNTRDLILEADELAREKGLNQTKWSNMAGKATNGQTVSRLLKRGDCRLSTMQSLLKPLGYRLKIVKEEEQ